MPWKEMTIEELAESLGINPSEAREKQHLIKLIIKARKLRGLSQANLAKKMGVTQGRIAQIEAGIGTTKVSFDILFHILGILGYDFKIVSKKVA